MSSRHWQTPIVLLILVVMAALMVLWLAPATAEEGTARRTSKDRAAARETSMRRQARADSRTGREAQPAPAPRSPASASPVTTTTEPTPVRNEPADPPATPIRTEVVSRTRERPRVESPDASPPTGGLPRAVRPELAASPAVVSEVPPRESPRPHLGPGDFDEAPPAPPPPPLDAPVLLPGGPGIGPGDGFCSEALVCPLDREDDYIAWRLVLFAGVRYWEVAYERLDGWSWYAVLERLEIPRRDFYAALGIEGWSEAVVFADAEVAREVRRQVGFHRLPAFRCGLPIELTGATRDAVTIDRFDGMVAHRIAEETLWCEEVLWQLFAQEGSWAGVARQLYLSPYLFEACFGVDLWVDTFDFVRYPSDDEIAWALQRRDALAGRAPGLGAGSRRSTLLGGVALLALVVGTGLAVGF